MADKDPRSSLRSPPPEGAYGALRAAARAPEDDIEIAAPARPWPPLLPWQVGIAREALTQPWPPALLIYGRRGIGKHALGLNLALALLCESQASDRLACGHCPSCRYAIAGQHPDLLRVELTEFNSDTGEFEAVDTILIARIRALIEFAQITSHRRKAKLAVIAPAERMNEQAANALLKTLEEPPAGTYLILVSDQPDRLAPTILSRCRRLFVPMPAEEAARAWLTEHGIAEPAAALAQASGSPLLALECAEGALQRERKAWLSALADPRGLPVIALAARIDAGSRDERRPRLTRALDWLIGWSVDLARVVAGGAPRQNRDFTPELERLSRRVKSIALFRYYRSLLDQRALITHPLQPRSVAEAALIDYQVLFG